jgi:hypothetical protein
MGLTPGSHAFDVVGTFEVIVVVGLVEPAPLTGGFAGLATDQLRAVALTLDATRVGNKERLTVQALTL